MYAVELLDVDGLAGICSFSMQRDEVQVALGLDVDVVILQVELWSVL